MDPTWTERFFEGIALDLWRSAVSPEQTEAEANFLEQQLRLPPGARVLDVPCGDGRHALALAARGHHLVGVDSSQEQIRQAEQTAAAAGRSVEWRRSDMRELPWEARFDGAYCFGNGFGYLDPAGNRDFVLAVGRALRPGARFVLDTGMAAESILPRLREREWLRIGDILFLEENRYHAADSCIETTYTFVRNRETEVRTGWQCVYTLRELRALLAEAGLETKALYRSLAGEPYEVGAPSLLLLAERT